MSTSASTQPLAIVFPTEVEVKLKIKASNQDDYDFITALKTGEPTLSSDLVSLLESELALEVTEVNGVRIRK